MPETAGRSGALAVELREIAGPDMYRRNAFRITGLPTQADAPTVRQRQQRVAAALSADIDADVHADADAVHLAFDTLRGDTRRRLVHELFWWWDSPDATCSCAASLHQDHDAAVRAHSTALDREAEFTALDAAGQRELDDLWETAADHWQQVLSRAAFWEHIRQRVNTLDDRRLDESAIDLLRDELPAFLLKPAIELAAAADDPERLADIAGFWPAPPEVIDDELENIAAPLFERIRMLLGQATEADGPAEKVAIVRSEVLPIIRRLDGLVPADCSHRTASTLNDVAIALTNCASAALSEPGPMDATAIRQWYDLALGIVVDDDTRQVIQDNLAAFDEIVQTLDEIQRRLIELMSGGQGAAAKRYLRQLLREIGDAPGKDLLDEMLQQVRAGRRPEWRSAPAGGRAPTGSPPPGPKRPPTRPPRPLRVRGGRRRLLRVGVISVSICGVVLGTILAVSTHSRPHARPGDTAAPAMLFSDRVSEDAPPGQCIATKQGWKGDKSRVPVVPCGRPHWGEVLGYVALAPAPSPYPGDDQVIALAQFQCDRMLAAQRLPGGYLADYIVPDQPSWNDGGGKQFQNYTTCVAYRADSRLLRSGRVIHPRQTVPDNLVISMNLYAGDIWEDAPTGTCVLTKASFATGPTDSVPVVPCRQRHWADIIGYPVLYQPGTKWPGQGKVIAKATDACGRLAKKSWAGSQFTFDFIYPSKQDFASQYQTLYATCVAYRADDQLMTG